MRSRYSVLTILLLTIAAARAALAQGDVAVSPPEIYPGPNVLTVRAPNGIKQIQILSATPNAVVEGAGAVSSCPTEEQLRITLTDANAAQIQLGIVDCRGRRTIQVLNASRTWNTDRNSFGTVEVGEVVCREFQIRTSGTGGDIFGGLTVDSPIFLDSISVDDPRISLRLPGRIPVKINSNRTYTYKVCFTADKPGVYSFPVTTWIRRTYPSGGLTSYPVADTGFIRVIPKPVRPDSVPPRRTPPPDTARFSYTPPEPEPSITDPTTFRTVAVPNAIIPKRGHGYVGVYDLLGLTAGYSVDDHLMVIGGGAIPTPDDWAGPHGDIFGAYSLGLKVGLPLADELHVAAGYQWGRSLFDRQNAPDTVRSEITVNAPYAAISYGDDDSRLSATFGYAFKHHAKKLAEFDQNAAFIAVGGDYRIGRHWKIAGELISMETLGVMPVIATGRYFTETFAIDFGVGYVGITTGDTKPPAIPLVPVLSGVFTF